MRFIWHSCSVRFLWAFFVVFLCAPHVLSLQVTVSPSSVAPGGTITVTLHPESGDGTRFDFTIRDAQGNMVSGLQPKNGVTASNPSRTVTLPANVHLGSGYFVLVTGGVSGAQANGARSNTFSVGSSSGGSGSGSSGGGGSGNTGGGSSGGGSSGGGSSGGGSSGGGSSGGGSGGGGSTGGGSSGSSGGSTGGGSSGGDSGGGSGGGFTGSGGSVGGSSGGGANSGGDSGGSSNNGGSTGGGSTNSGSTGSGSSGSGSSDGNTGGNAGGNLGEGSGGGPTGGSNSGSEGTSGGGSNNGSTPQNPTASPSGTPISPSDAVTFIAGTSTAQSSGNGGLVSSTGSPLSQSTGVSGGVIASLGGTAVHGQSTQALSFGIFTQTSGVQGTNISPSTLPSANPDDPGRTGGALKPGAIAGIVVGIILFLLILLLLFYYLCIRRRVHEKDEWEKNYTTPTTRALPYTRQTSALFESHGSQVALAAGAEDVDNGMEAGRRSVGARTSIGGRTSVGGRSRFASVDLNAHYRDDTVPDDRSEVLPRYPMSETSSLHDEKLEVDETRTGPYSGFTTQRMAELHEERMRMRELIDIFKSRPRSEYGVAV